MRFARSKHGLLLDAFVADESDGTCCCCCNNPVRYIRRSTDRVAHYRHVTSSASCKLSVHDQQKRHREGDNSCDNNKKSPWHITWQNTGKIQWPERYEARNIGGDPRPRDLGNIATGEVIEFQHSYISGSEYTARCDTASRIVWVFDATNCPLFRYVLDRDGLFFCQDTYKEEFETSDSRCVLFHCSDGHLYRAIVAAPVYLEIAPDNFGHFRVLRRLQEMDWGHTMLDEFLGTSWPLEQHSLVQAELWKSHIRVLGAYGRELLDQVHRSYLDDIPVQPLTIITAPPGAGKTTAIVDAMHAWQCARADIQMLVLTFNTSARDTMRAALCRKGVTAKAMTLDGVCFQAVNGKGDDFLGELTDKKLCTTYWPKTDYQTKQRCGGYGSAAILEFCLRHPNTDATICNFHSKLTKYKVHGSKWSASPDSFPSCKIVDKLQTFAARRYVCDRDTLLGPVLDKYDVVVVDEMQDCMGGQERRLLAQTTKPVVMIGDPMQQIYGFRDDSQCQKCQLHAEPVPPLIDAIEWYGTWRLDATTAAFVEERFNRLLYSYQPIDNKADIVWAPEPRYSNTLLLCRSNESVVDCLQQYKGLRVLQGQKLSERIQAAARDASMRHPMARYARSLGDEIRSVCKLLQECHIDSLDNIDTMNIVCTVHQAKGFECDHVAVHSNLLNPENDEAECNISFVAFTRHRRSLTILSE